MLAFNLACKHLKLKVKDKYINCMKHTGRNLARVSSRFRIYATPTNLLHDLKRLPIIYHLEVCLNTDIKMYTMHKTTL